MNDTTSGKQPCSGDCLSCAYMACVHQGIITPKEEGFMKKIAEDTRLTQLGGYRRNPASAHQKARQYGFPKAGFPLKKQRGLRTHAQEKSPGLKRDQGSQGFDPTVPRAAGRAHTGPLSLITNNSV